MHVQKAPCAGDVQVPSSGQGITRPLILLFAIATAVIVTNLFAPQTLVGLIGPSMGFSATGAGFVAMVTLLGYAAGLFLLVPLADLLENRALTIGMIACAVLTAVGAAVARNGAVLLVTLFALGAACSAIQILVPLAASMAKESVRGQVIGDVMTGLMVGILFARPLASLIATAWGWRSFYASSAVAMGALAVILGAALPRRKPVTQSSYMSLIASLWHLLRREPTLRHRALTASLAMAAFSLFWTSVALRLSQPPYDLGQPGIALFALLGAGGAAATSFFGRAGDRGWTRPATIASHVVIIVAMAMGWLADSFQGRGTMVSLTMMAASALLLDIGVTGDQTLGRRAINLLDASARARINGLFVGIFFLGGGIGSGAAGYAWVWGGWGAICAVGMAMGILALCADRFFRPT